MQFLSIVFGVVFVINHVVKGQENWVSPCPEVFRYLPGNPNEPDKWYGEITVISDEDLFDGVFMVIKLDKPSLMIGVSSTLGQRIDKRSETEYLVSNFGYHLKANTPLSVKFFIKYDLNKEVPKFLEYRLNAVKQCTASKTITTTSSPEEYITSGGFDPFTLLSQKNGNNAPIATTTTQNYPNNLLSIPQSNQKPQNVNPSQTNSDFPNNQYSFQQNRPQNAFVPQNQNTFQSNRPQNVNPSQTNYDFPNNQYSFQQNRPQNNFVPQNRPYNVAQPQNNYFGNQNSFLRPQNNQPLRPNNNKWEIVIQEEKNPYNFGGNYQPQTQYSSVNNRNRNVHKVGNTEFEIFKL